MKKSEEMPIVLASASDDGAAPDIELAAAGEAAATPAGDRRTPPLAAKRRQRAEVAGADDQLSMFGPSTMQGPPAGSLTVSSAMSLPGAGSLRLPSCLEDAAARPQQQAGGVEDGSGGDGGSSELLSRSFWQGRPLKWWLTCAWLPGCRLPQLLLCVAVALLLIFAVPRPPEISEQGWGLLGVFVATIVGLIVRPLPMGGVCVLSLAVCLWSGLMTFAQATEGFTESVVWLIVSALLMAQAVDKTGLGRRVSLLCIAAVGHSALGLTYALMLADLILALGMPSTTAREGGVFMPIIRGISQSFGSHPGEPSRKLLGAFLAMAQLQHTQPTSAMWLTGAAPNAMAIGLARQQGVVLPGGDWVVWAKGACVPALAIMAATPPAVFLLYRPQVTRTPEAPRAARAALARLGRPGYGEWVTLGVLVFALSFWVCGGYLPRPVGTAPVALMALALLLCAGVLTWEGDCLGCHAPWDTLFWISILMSQSKALTDRGVIDHFAGRVAARLSGGALPPAGVWALLLVVYVAAHYLFASQSAHVAAMYPPFLAVMLKCGISPVLAAMSLAYIGNALTGMTHYASAESVVYFSTGYYGVGAVWGVGAALTILNMALWLPLGLGWWKAVGFYSDLATMR